MITIVFIRNGAEGSLNFLNLCICYINIPHLLIQHRPGVLPNVISMINGEQIKTQPFQEMQTLTTL